MPAQIVTCPGCNSRYQTSAQPGQRLQCPKCKATLVIPAPLAVRVRPATRSVPRVRTTSGRVCRRRPVASFPQPGPLAGKPAHSRRAGSAKGFSFDPELVPFLKRLGLGIGIVLASIVVTAIGGFFSEPVAMGATIIGLVAVLGLALAGRVWFVVIAFQESALLGVATIFVPMFRF